jgi:ribonuclease E
VLAEGKRDELAPKGPVEEGAQTEVKLVEVGLHDPAAGVGKLDESDVCVADAAKLVGRKVKIQVERVLDGSLYATLADAKKAVEEPITAEGEAEKPTRRPPARKTEAVAEDREAAADEPAAESEDAPGAPKKKTRRGTRGGRGRKRPAKTAAAAAENGAGATEEAVAAAKIHVPDPSLGEEPEAAEPEEPAAVEEEAAAPAEDGAGAPKPKKKTRRGTRGGRNRRKKPTATAATDGATETSDADAPAATTDENWEYVPMAEWGDDVEETNA